MSKPTKEEMVDTLEHCRTNMKSSEVQAYAGKWIQRDNDTVDAIRRLIEKMGEWQSHAMAILCSEFPEYDGTDVIDFMREIRDFDFGKEKK